MSGHNSNGQFAKGNQEWRKRRRKGPTKAEDFDNLVAMIDANVSPEAVASAWRRVSVAMEHGGRGWIDLFKLYLDRRYGKPAQYIDQSVELDGELGNIIRFVWEDSGDDDQAPTSTQREATDTDML